MAGPGVMFGGVVFPAPVTVDYFPTGIAPVGFGVATLDPWVGTRDDPTTTAYMLSNRGGIRSPRSGDPYFALTHLSPFVLTLPQNEVYLACVAGITSLPQMLADPDEHHPLVSLFEDGPGGRDLAYLAITPSGRLVGWSVGYPGFVQTGPGFVVADGAPHLYAFDNTRSSQYLGTVTPDPLLLQVDGTIVVQATYYRSEVFPANGTTRRYMLFNGRSGLSRYEATMSYAVAALSDAAGGPARHIVEWDLSGRGPAFPGTESPGFGTLPGDTLPGAPTTFTIGPVSGGCYSGPPVTSIASSDLYSGGTHLLLAVLLRGTTSPQTAQPPVLRIGSTDYVCDNVGRRQDGNLTVELWRTQNEVPGDHQQHLWTLLPTPLTEASYFQAWVAPITGMHPVFPVGAIGSVAGTSLTQSLSLPLSTPDRPVLAFLNGGVCFTFDSGEVFLQACGTGQPDGTFVFRAPSTSPAVLQATAFSGIGGPTYQLSAFEVNPIHPTQTDFDWNLYAEFYDPSANGQGLPWGAIPSGAPHFDHAALGTIRERDSAAGGGTFRRQGVTGSYSNVPPPNPNYRRSG